MKVKAVLRFWYGGKLADKGQVLEVDESLGREVVASGKAVKVEEAPAATRASPTPPAQPAPPEAAPE